MHRTGRWMVNLKVHRMGERLEEKLADALEFLTVLLLEMMLPQRQRMCLSGRQWDLPVHLANFHSHLRVGQNTEN